MRIGMNRVRLIFILCLFVVAGAGSLYLRKTNECKGAGLISTIHQRPLYVEKGEPIELEIGLDHWGPTNCITPEQMEGGRPKNLFSDVQCHFKLQAEAAYTAVPMTLIRDDMKPDSYHLYYRCAIPPLDFETNIAKMDYYFDWSWNGSYEKQEQLPVSIFTPIVSREQLEQYSKSNK